MNSPKFIANLPDDLHCVQACVGMVLSYFLEDQQFSMTDLETITGFVPGLATWEMAELLSYGRYGLQVKVITEVSYQEFADRGFAYLEEVEGPEIAAWSKENTADEKLERQRAAEVAQKELSEQRIPTQQDIRKLLADGWLIMVGVNARKLNGKDGFAGHRVLIYQNDETSITMHDPGLPPEPARRVSWDLLEAAWADPNEQAKQLIAVRKTP